MLSLSLGLSLTGLAGAAQGAVSPFTVAIWGQSELANILSSGYDGTTAEALVAQDRVTFWHHDRDTDGAAGVQSVTLNDTSAATSTVTAAMVAMANTFMRQLPGRDIHILMHTQSGTTPEEIMDDSYDPDNPDGQPRRRWQDDWALHSGATTAIGKGVDYLLQQWYASNRTWGTNYGPRMFAFLTGRDSLDGSPLTYSVGSPLSFAGITIQRTLADLYGTVPPIIKTPGAHVFVPRSDMSADLENAVTLVGGGVATGQVNTQNCTESWRDVTGDTALASYFTAAETFSLQGVAYGEDQDDNGAWLDWAHPSGWTDVGIPRWAKMIAHTILRGAGITSFTVPAFDNSEWDAAGAHVDVWSSAGAITTFRGGGGPTATPAEDHWTDVVGFEIDGEPVERAEIQPNGRVRIYPVSGSFSSGSTLQFGRGGGTGMLVRDTDLDAALWDDYPIVDVGLPDLAGIPVKVLHPDTIASTIVGAPTFTTSSGGPYFLGPNGVGTQSVITIRVKGTLDAISGTQQLAGMDSGQLNVLVLNNGAIRINGRDSAGQVLNSKTTLSGLIQAGVQFDVVVCYDLDAETYALWVNGVSRLSGPLDNATTGVFDSARRIHLIADSNGTEQCVGEFERVTVWFEATTDGTLPSGTPYKDITGPQATAEADAWAQP